MSVQGHMDEDRRRARRPWARCSLGLLALLAAACSDGGGDEPADRPTTTAVTTTTAAALDPPTHPSVVAHRGASAAAPENTLAAFDLAKQRGADMIELDVQLTSDGELAVLHDPTLDRTARGPADRCTGAVGARTLAQVRSCDAGTWFNDAHPDLARPAFADERIPSLADALGWGGHDVRWLIEIKSLGAGDDAMERALAADLDDAGFSSDAPVTAQVVVQSFDADSLQRMKEVRPDLALTRLVSPGQPLDGTALDDIATYATGIGPSWGDVDAALVDAAHERCLTVVPWTIDDPAAMSQLLDLGVDGIISNHPDRVLALAGELGWDPPCR